MVLCRLCLIDSSTFLDIFGAEGRSLKISKILSEFFWFQIVENDAISTAVCQQCWLNTTAFQSFHSSIRQAQQNLRKHLTYNNDIKSESVVEDNPNEDAKLSSIDVSSVNLDKGTDEIRFKLEQSDNCQLALQQDSAENSNDYLKIPVRRTRRVKSKPTATSNHKDVQYSDEESTNDDDNEDDDEDGCNDDKVRISVTTNQPKKPKVKTVTDDHIRSICNLFCSICHMSFDTFLSLTKHYRDTHDRKGFVMCCDRKLTTRARLLEHVETHLNPDAFKCSVCDARLRGRFLLKRHMDTHMTFEERPFACSECPNRYTNGVLLAAHRASRHCREEDKTFVCTVCEKKFTSVIKLGKHVKQTHDFVPEICDFCGKEFKCLSNLNVHRREVHMEKEMSRKQCNMCGKWLREQYLKKHIKRHNAEVETCTVCGKTLQNKHTLGNHMRYVHGDRMHQCTLCDKTFTKPMSLREHLATHTGKDLYTCGYCPKTFKSDSNMYSHRKKSHFEEWTRDRERRSLQMEFKT